MVMLERLKKELQELHDSNNYRTLISSTHTGKCSIINGQKLLNFSSNDYLGLADLDDFNRAFLKNIDPEKIFLFGSTSSRLLSGNCEAYNELESVICKKYHIDSCLIFNSGYHANTGVIPALMKKKDLILADKLVHASIIDGIRMSEAECIRYRHLDYNHLESIIKKNRDKYRSVLIISESVFSMDGDIADLKTLIEIKKKYDCLLYIDEAHAVGVFGKSGLGIAEEVECIHEIDILTGTLGKAFASLGAYVLSSGTIREYLINKVRPFIFTTALPPINLMWSNYVFDNLTDLKVQRESVIQNSSYFRKRLGLNKSEGSQIIPIIIGENKKCIEISEYLKNEGYYVPAIKPPTVPEGSSRLRVSITACFSEEEIKKLADKIIFFNEKNLD